MRSFWNLVFSPKLELFIHRDKAFYAIGETYLSRSGYSLFREKRGSNITSDTWEPVGTGPFRCKQLFMDQLRIPESQDNVSQYFGGSEVNRRNNLSKSFIWLLCFLYNLIILEKICHVS
jgi:hypothetical protein